MCLVYCPKRNNDKYYALILSELFCVHNAHWTVKEIFLTFYHEMISLQVILIIHIPARFRKFNVCTDSRFGNDLASLIPGQ